MHSSERCRGVPVADRQQPFGNETERWADAALHMARRFHRGATLWCAAPRWPWHADHVAVEFVHPVVVGKRSLPAVALSSADWVDQIRSRSRPGDMVLSIGSPGDPDLEQAARRTSVWGLTTVWLDVGTAASSPLHIGVEGADPAYGGELVRAYHLLWELSHVCFEHPGLLDDSDDSVVDRHCITCSDEGRLAEIVEMRAGDHAAVRSSAGMEEVDTTLVADARPGDVVLVHAGAAISAVLELDLGTVG